MAHSVSKTALTIRELRARGFFAQNVEKRIPKSFITKDLFGWLDLVAVHPDHRGVLGVQVTTDTNRNKHYQKLRDPSVNAPLTAWLKAGNSIVMWSWAKKKERNKDGSWAKRGRWRFRELPVVLEDLELAATLPWAPAAPSEAPVDPVDALPAEPAPAGLTPAGACPSDAAEQSEPVTKDTPV